MPHVRPFVATIALLLAGPVAPAAHAQVDVATGSRVETHVVAAPSLAGNLIGDDAEKSVLVYLPPGYDPAATRYPVVYLLHGIFDDPEVWTEYYRLPAMLDRMMAAGEMPPAIVVMPDGGNQFGGGFYRNSPVTGNWGDFIADDLVAFIDATYATDPRPAARVLAGHSMGGYGAIHLTMERPGVFGIAYAMSPCCLAPVEDTGPGNISWRRVVEMESWDELQVAIEARDFWTVAVVGFWMAFSPDPEAAPFFIDIPYEVVRGETLIVEDVYTPYRERFPLYRLDERRSALMALDGLAMDYGIRDQFSHIPEGTRRISERLTELRVPHRLEVYDGDHREQLAERLERVVFPYIAERLTRSAD